MFPREIPPRLEERGSVVDECCCRNDNPYHNLNSGKWASRSPTPTQGGLLAVAGRDHSLRIYSHPQPQKIECSPFRFNFNRTHSTRRIMPGAPFMRSLTADGWDSVSHPKCYSACATRHRVQRRYAKMWGTRRGVTACRNQVV
jgi:hypothetical protein